MTARHGWLAIAIALGCGAPTDEADTADSGSTAGSGPSPDSTEDPAPAEFTDKVVPFFRGRVCTELSVASGSSFPVHMSPCLHPCLDLGLYHFRHSWTCIGPSCEAFGLEWVIASATSCPSDAFGRFDPSQCQYAAPIEFTIETSWPGGDGIEGEMRLEIPYLSNEDAEMIAANPDDLALRERLIAKYPRDDNRVPGGTSIDLQADNPTPPTTCGPTGEACDCFDVGF